MRGKNLEWGKVGNWYFAFKLGKDGKIYVRDVCHFSNMDNKAHPIILDDDFILETGYMGYDTRGVFIIKKLFEYDIA